MSISRLRMATDGPGVSTLVTFWGCPLQYEYCANWMCHDAPYIPNVNTSNDIIKSIAIIKRMGMLSTELGNILVYGTIIGVLGNRSPKFNDELKCHVEDFKRLSHEGSLCI